MTHGRTFGLFFGLLFSCGLQLRGQTPDSPARVPVGYRSMTQAVNTIEASIVQIQFIALHVRRPLPDGTTPMVFSSPVGTGFLVNDQYVLTARHVIYTGREWLNQVDADQKKLVVAKPNIQGERYKDATVGLTVRGTFTSYTFEVVDEDGEHDLALLKLIHAFRR